MDVVVSWLPAALPGAGALLTGFGEEPRFGVWGSLPLLLSSHCVVALGKFFWPWLITPHSPPGGAALPAPSLGWGPRSSGGLGSHS